MQSAKNLLSVSVYLLLKEGILWHGTGLWSAWRRRVFRTPNSSLPTRKMTLSCLEVRDGRMPVGANRSERHSDWAWGETSSPGGQSSSGAGCLKRLYCPSLGSFRPDLLQLHNYFGSVPYQYSYTGRIILLLMLLKLLPPLPGFISCLFSVCLLYYVAVQLYSVWG